MSIRMDHNLCTGCGICVDIGSITGLLKKKTTAMYQI